MGALIRQSDKSIVINQQYFFQKLNYGDYVNLKVFLLESKIHLLSNRVYKVLIFFIESILWWVSKTFKFILKVESLKNS